MRSIPFLTALALLAGCKPDESRAPKKAQKQNVQKRTPPQSAYPVAVDLEKVGKYPARTKAGGGYFYDDVLEYRVWIDYDDRSDEHHAFATFEAAEAFAKKTPKAKSPLVLVRQVEHVNEPKTGVFEHKKENRVTEWRVQWLAANKRHPHSIQDFLSKRRLVGTWETATGPSTRITYAKDGTWTSTTTAEGKEYRGTGTWKIEKGVLLNTTTKHDPMAGTEKIELPYLSKEKLVEVLDDQYRYVCPVQGSTNTMRRATK